MKQKLVPGRKIICLNRKASFNYFFLGLLEIGIVLIWKIMLENREILT